MKQLYLILGLILLIAYISCDKENEDIALKLKDGSYMGLFSYDNNHLWESFIIQKDSFVEFASGGAIFQKFPDYYLTKGTYEKTNTR